ncbi:unnamed protein product, partial [Ixodes hexagonus]
LLAPALKACIYGGLAGFFKVTCLDVSVDSHQSLLERVIAAGVQHLHLDLRALRTPAQMRTPQYGDSLVSPGHEDEPVHGHATFGGALCAHRHGEVEDAVPALVFELLQLLEEVSVGGVTGARRLHIDHPLVLDVVDDVAVFLVLLHLFIHRLGFVGHCHPGR